MDLGSRCLGLGASSLRFGHWTQCCIQKRCQIHELNDQRDAWLAGFDNRHLGVIWVGRDDNQPMPFTGSSAALPIWLDTFREAGSEPLPPATALKMAAVNEQGQLVGSGCRGTLYPFISSRLPQDLTECKQKAPEKEKKSWLDWLF